jgi:hypothetical protein
LVLKHIDEVNGYYGYPDEYTGADLATEGHSEGHRRRLVAAAVNDDREKVWIPGSGMGELGNKTYSSIESVDAALHWEMYEHLFLLEQFYLGPLIGTSVKFYSEHATSAIDNGETMMLMVLIILLVLISLSYFFSIQRLVISLDNEMKRTRGLLLMVPDDILQSLPSLRRFLLSEIKAQEKRK